MSSPKQPPEHQTSKPLPFHPSQKRLWRRTLQQGHQNLRLSLVRNWWELRTLIRTNKVAPTLTCLLLLIFGKLISSQQGRIVVKLLKRAREPRGRVSCGDTIITWETTDTSCILRHLTTSATMTASLIRGSNSSSASSSWPLASWDSS